MIKNSISLIDSCCVVEGTFSSTGDCDVIGKISGNIVVNTLNVKDGGVITGKIYVKELNISGGSKVEGDIYAEKIKICNTSTMTGNVFYNILSIEDGGIVQGNFSKNTKEQIWEIFDKEIEKLQPKEKVSKNNKGK